MLRQRKKTCVFRGIGRALGGWRLHRALRNIKIRSKLAAVLFEAIA